MREKFTVSLTNVSNRHNDRKVSFDKKCSNKNKDSPSIKVDSEVSLSFSVEVNPHHRNKASKPTKQPSKSHKVKHKEKDKRDHDNRERKSDKHDSRKSIRRMSDSLTKETEIPTINCDTWITISAVNPQKSQETPDQKVESQNENKMVRNESSNVKLKVQSNHENFDGSFDYLENGGQQVMKKYEPTNGRRNIPKDGEYDKVKKVGAINIEYNNLKLNEQREKSYIDNGRESTSRPENGTAGGASNMNLFPNSPESNSKSQNTKKILIDIESNISIPMKRGDKNTKSKSQHQRKSDLKTTDYECNSESELSSDYERRSKPRKRRSSRDDRHYDRLSDDDRCEPRQDTQKTILSEFKMRNNEGKNFDIHVNINDAEGNESGRSNVNTENSGRSNRKNMVTSLTDEELIEIIGMRIFDDLLSVKKASSHY